MKAISVNDFESDIVASDLSKIDPQRSVNMAASSYNRVLSELLEHHAPLCKKTVTIHPNAPWYTPEIAVAKKERRTAENTWRKTKLCVHREIFTEKREMVNQLLTSAKEDYYSSKVKDCPDQKSLFRVMNTLLNKTPNTSLPDHESSQDLANRFNDFFAEKITRIRQRLDSVENDSPLSVPVPSEDESTSPPAPLAHLEPTSDEEVRKIVMESKSTTCRLDPIPTSFLKIVINVLVPILTQIINMSFEQGVMPQDLKEALIIPLLKKLGLDVEILKNFRPISNLPFLSKLIERVSAKRLLDHMDLNKLHELFQSAYKKFHSTETALLRVQSDVLQAIDQKKCVILVLLDLSAAFDTIDHKILMERLQSRMGLSGTALNWFQSYILGRIQSVLINGTTSSILELLFGVPQGSVLGPLLFIIYTGPLGDLLRSLGINYHLYADDTQLYLTFDLHDAPDMIRKIENAVVLIKQWMTNNFLCLNEDKTEVLVLGSEYYLPKLSIPTVAIGNEQIVPAKNARNIGFYFDSTMNLKKQIGETCKAAWLHLRNIGKIRKYLDKESTEKLVHAFITSKIDVNNSLLYGLPDTLLQRLQRIQNSAARLVTRSKKHDHITPILCELHWLPVQQRILYKVLLIVFKAIHNLAPMYVADMIVQKPDSKRSMRSNENSLLIVPRARTTTYGDRNFRVFAPLLWNQLPLHMRKCDDLNAFKKYLKTHLYEIAYD
jgi:hypothetical protein